MTPWSLHFVFHEDIPSSYPRSYLDDDLIYLILRMTTTWLFLGSKLFILFVLLTVLARICSRYNKVPYLVWWARSQSIPWWPWRFQHKHTQQGPDKLWYEVQGLLRCFEGSWQLWFSTATEESVWNEGMGIIIPIICVHFNNLTHGLFPLTFTLPQGFICML